MARKKPEAIVALEAIAAARPLCCECDAVATMRKDDKNFCAQHFDDYHRRNAAPLPEHLKRQPNESFDAWRKRALRWLADQCKRIGRAP